MTIDSFNYKLTINIGRFIVMNTSLVPVYEKLVNHFGGQTKTARALNVKQPSVHAWIKGEANMSPLVALRAEKQTNGIFEAEQLCPEIKQATA